MNGKCYVNSFLYMEELIGRRDAENDEVEREKYADLMLIHGSVVPIKGPDAGKRLDHAWIEMAGHVFEVSESMANPSVTTIEDYQKHFDSHERARYTIDQARQMIETSEIYGPWDAEGRKLRGLPPIHSQTTEDNLS